MSDESQGLVKWKAALAVGVGAVALAGGALLAYYALTRSQRSATSEENAGEAVTSPQGTPTSTIPEESKTNSGTTSQSTLERAQAIKQQGNEFYKQQKYEEAIKCYKEAISVCPVSKPADLAIFHQNLAAVYDVLAQKATDPDQKTSCLLQVLENCTRAFEHNPRYVKAMTRRLKVYEALGRRKEAILDVTRVLVLDESQGRALSQTVTKLLKDFGQLQAKENFPKLGPLAPNKYLIKTYFQSFSWCDDLSESRLKQLWSTRTKPKTLIEPPELVREDGSELTVSDQSDAQELTDDADFNEEPFVRAAAAFREEKYHGILEILTEAITSGNAVFVPHALLLRGALNSLWRQGQKALKDLQDVVNTQGLSKEMYTNALVQRACMMALHGEMEKCQTCFTKALAIDPNCSDVFIYRARLVLESEDQQSFTNTVVEDLEKGQSLAPTSPQAAYLLSSAYHRMAGMQQSMQLLETARTKFSEAVQKFPNFGDGLLLYAMFLQDANQVKEAEEILNKVIKLEPENPIGHFTLGLTTLMATQDIDRAVEHMETAIAKDNSCVQAYNTLATIEMQRGNTEKAMDMYENAISYSRSEAEMSQAYVSREVVTAQNQACKEYGVTQAELASRAYGAPGGGGGVY